MQIIRTVFYGKKLKKILEYIAKDKLSASKRFKKELDEQINEILVFPRKYRKSKYFEDRIEILTVFNQNLPLK